MIKLQQEMTKVLVPALEAITPGSGCYLNEVLLPTLPFASPFPFPPISHRTSSVYQMQLVCAHANEYQSPQGDPYQPNWQETFYGANYPRLRSIKAKYDPNDIFYATTAVGSDEWEVQSPGVLCRVSS